jgi:hypothetical protein
MTAASNESANQSILAHEAGKGTCFGCGSYDHQVAACPLTRPDQHCNNSKPRGRGRPRGGRGGCGRGGGSRDTGLGGVGFKQTYLQTRGREGTRGAPLRRGFGNKSNRNGGVNGIGGEDEQYEEYYNELDTLRNGGVNGIGGEDEQYEEYYNELDTLELDTLSLNKANGELDAGVTIGMKLRMENSIKSIRTPTFNHKQDPDGKDGSLLGDHGRAEAEDLPTTRRTRSISRDGTNPTSSTGGRSLVSTSILCEENNIGPK